MNESPLEGSATNTHSRVPQRSIVLSVILFVLIVVGMFVFAYLKKHEVEAPAVVVNEEVEGEVAYAGISRIDATHFFDDGEHTLVGEITMPTPCDLLESSASVAESFPEQVQVNFTVINNSETCAQVLTSTRFKVSASASAEATFSARLQGRVVELNLIPAPPGESPDNFEIFIKG